MGRGRRRQRRPTTRQRLKVHNDNIMQEDREGENAVLTLLENLQEEASGFRGILVTLLGQKQNAHG